MNGVLSGITASERTARKITTVGITASRITVSETTTSEITASRITVSETTTSEITASRITVSRIAARICNEHISTLKIEKRKGRKLISAE